VTLGDGNVKEVWKGDNASNLMFDNVGKQLAFLTSAVDCKYCGPSLWCYNSSAGKVNRIIEDKSAETDSTMQIDRIQGFSKDGERVFVYLKEMKEIERRPIPDAIQINVWSYRDIRLQSQQLKEINETRNYLSVINIKNRNVIRLEDKNEISRRINDDYILIIHYLSDAHSSEFRWNKAFKRTQYLVSTKSGERKYLDSFKDYNVNISTNGKFLIFYDAEKKDYLCYEIESGIIRNLTRGIDTKWTAYQSYALRNVAAWLEDDQAVLIYDEFDIWQVDPKNIRKPINVTNHYGKSKSIIFFLPYESNDRPIDLLNEGILTAFNPLNKSNGFYSVKKGYKQDPKMLVMEDYVFDVERVISGILAIPGGVSFKPIGSGSGNAYIVKRSSATEFPNYFSTHDFKEFISLSNIHPEKAYNWYSTELHTWKTINGDTLQGILYKPENFDSLKRYPIIFYYYDKRSDGLNAYWKPDYLTNASVTNIPYYVSNGYLMVGFDIKYRTGEIGKSVLESAISAARYFSNKPFINQGKMGINGYSHGGYETYYLVAHTSLFAAASGGGGIVDLISFYGSLKDNSYSAQEMGQMDLGNVTLWERPDLYIKNSPIFKADQVSTPLLMMHTTYDGAVDIHQAIEFFTALRSLGKKVWLLEYEDGNHGLYGKSQIDYSKRMMQFFDLYLKDKPAPKWMLDGIPAKLKGIDTGLELDTTGRIPGPGLTNNPECITEQ
jgi:dipeptidyl aminopeptidase/acylaminoacyl peptidase